MKHKAKSLSENTDAVKDAQAKIDGVLGSGNRSQDLTRSSISCALFSSFAETLVKLINQKPSSKKIKVSSVLLPTLDFLHNLSR